MAIAMAMRSNVPLPTPAREKAHGRGASAEPAMANKSGAAVSSTDGEDGSGFCCDLEGDNFTGSMEGGRREVVAVVMVEGLANTCANAGADARRGPS